MSPLVSHGSSDGSQKDGVPARENGAREHGTSRENGTARDTGRDSEQAPTRGSQNGASSVTVSQAVGHVSSNKSTKSKWTLWGTVSNGPMDDEEDEDGEPGNNSDSKRSASKDGHVTTFPTHYTGRRRCVAHVVENMLADGVVGIVILFNFVLICVDTDAHVREELGEEPESSPEWVEWGMQACFVFYVLEMCLKVYVEQTHYLRNPWNRFDVFLITWGAFETVAKRIHLHFGGMGALRLLDLGRLLRLLKVLRLFSIFKELRRLMYMFAGCFRTIAWSFTLLVGVMTIWACVAVELIHPIVLDILDDTPSWYGHDRARRAFASVFDANITLWQTIVAHDSWGVMAIPVIEHRPWTAFIFAGALLTLVFGVLNVIVVVMVDSCAESRARDFMNKALDIEEEEKHQKRVLSKMFRMIDEDASGSVSWEELKDGSMRVEEFKHWLRVMDVDEDDLQQLFSIVDTDGSGFIDHDEFTEAMYRLKNAESRTTTKLIKFLVTRMEQKQNDMESKQAETQAELGIVRSDLTRVTSEHMNNLRHFVSQSQEAIAAKILRQESNVVQQMESAIVRALDMTLEDRFRAVMSELQSVLTTASGHDGRRTERPVERGVSRKRFASVEGSEYVSFRENTGESTALTIGALDGGSVRQLTPHATEYLSNMSDDRDGPGREPLDRVGATDSQRSAGPTCPQAQPTRLLRSM